MSDLTGLFDSARTRVVPPVLTLLPLPSSPSLLPTAPLTPGTAAVPLAAAVLGLVLVHAYTSALITFSAPE